MTLDEKIEAVLVALKAAEDANNKIRATELRVELGKLTMADYRRN